MRTHRLLVLVALGGSACSSSGAARLPDAGADAAPEPVPATALFEVPRDAPPPSGFYALPYPTDLRLDGAGRIDLADHPQPNAILADYLATIAEEQRYFGLSSAIYVRFDAPLDPDSLPETAAQTFSPSASVYLVDVDPSSPERGKRVPLRVRFQPRGGEVIGDNWLAALPYPGFVLAERRTYALVVSDRVRGLDGTPVRRPADFAAIAASEVPADAALARAQEVHQPLWEWLDLPGEDERADVVVATVFTTQDATSLLGRVREVIWEQTPVPVATSMQWSKNLGPFALYEGTFESPRFQAGRHPYRQPSDGGSIAVGVDGRPEVQSMDELRFALTVPQDRPPPTGWPVALYAHGTGGDFQTFVRNGTARRLAEQGIACLSIDQLMHGDRQPAGLASDLAFFNYQNPRAARGNVLQSALDDFQLLRLALAFDYVERRPGGRVVRFDPERIYFFGHSQGSVTGVPFVASEPLVQGAVFSGAGGLLYLTMLHKTRPVDVSAMLGLLIRDTPLDEFHPVLALLQAYFDPADGISYARKLVHEPPEGMAPKHVFQLEGLVDRYTPVPTIEALATAMQLDLVEPELAPIEGLALRARQVLRAPVDGNAGGVTAVLAQYQERDGSDGHFVAFDVPAAMRQSVQFLATLAHAGSATVVALD